MKKLAAALLLALAAACATMPASGPTSIPPGQLDLGGEWRTASIGSVHSRFQSAAQTRYRPGLSLAAASGDLGRQGFRCAANTDRRGDPPDQVCRKTVTYEGCTHTWQVHLYDQTQAALGGALARTRALYDRRCGGEGLLGGPS
jgi:hypothetical protein